MQTATLSKLMMAVSIGEHHHDRTRATGSQSAATCRQRRHTTSRTTACRTPLLPETRITERPISQAKILRSGLCCPEVTEAMSSSTTYHWHPATSPFGTRVSRTLASSEELSGMPTAIKWGTQHSRPALAPSTTVFFALPWN